MQITRLIKHGFVAALALFMGATVCAVLALAILAGALTRGPLELPQAQAFVEKALNKQLDDRKLGIGSVALRSDAGDGANQIQMRDVTLSDAAGTPVLTLKDVRTEFSMMDALRGRLAPQEVTIVDTHLVLRRDKDGRIDLLASEGASEVPDIPTLLEGLTERPEFAALERIAFSGATVSLIDELSGATYGFDTTELALTRDGDRLILRAGILLARSDGTATEGATPAVMRLSADWAPEAAETTLAFQFEDADPAQIADLFPTFDWLRFLQTRTSGSMRAALADDGTVGEVSGVLDMGQGRLSGTPDNSPITFDHAKVYFDYLPGADTLNLRQVEAVTSSGSVKASGYARLTRDKVGAVTAMTTQLRVTDILIDREDLFDAPVKFAEAALDARITFAPLAVEVGRFTVFDEGGAIRLTGTSRAEEAYWSNRYSIDVSAMKAERVQALWPKPAVKKTRRWVTENIHSGTIRNFRGGVRSDGGKFAFGFNFDATEVSARLVKTVPFLQDGRGHGTLTQDEFRVTLESGHVIAGDDTKVTLDGSSLFIPDIEARPTPGEITLKAKGGIQAVLHLLDSDRFRFISKAGLSPELASGQAEVTGEMKLPLKKEAKIKDMVFEVRATLTDVASDTLVKNRRLRAETLDLLVTDADGIAISGALTLDGVPLNASWRQAFGAEGQKGSSVAARVPLSDAYLQTFGVKLPKGAVAGQAIGQMDIALKRGRAPRFELTSNLSGARLAIPSIGWSKPKASAGLLRLSGTLGAVPQVEEITLSGGGLSAKGRLDMKPGGGLARAVLTDLRIGRWLDTSAVIVPRGQTGSDITLNGGAMDLRAFSSGGAGRSSGIGATRITAKLDRVTVTNELSLTGVTTQLTIRGGLRGDFTGKVNGGTTINGTVFPREHGTAIELVSNNAGGVMASAGLLKNAKWGDMRVVLLPRPGKGNYDGTLSISKVRLKGASAMADLLNAISLVGLLQQLNGSGIHFSTVEGAFALRDGAVQLKDISAVGPSMGITLDGWYNARTKSVDFEGVTTPLYAVNGVFERIFGPLVGRKKGEGMFSFTYRMRGPADKPKVAVNPLSILTPGAFREIFRQRAPAPPMGFNPVSETPSVARTSTKQGEAPSKAKPAQTKAQKKPANRHSTPQPARDAVR